jgi:hypothetical protein
MATNPKWFTFAGLIRSFGDRYGAVFWAPVLQGFFTSWLAFLVTANFKFYAQMRSIIFIARFSLRNFRFVSSQSSCGGAVHYSSSALS